MAMDVAQTLELLQQKALQDEKLKGQLFATRQSHTPIRDFCDISTKAGLPLYEMDLIEYGESSYAAIRRSTNGGGENSPLLNYEDDAYEMFLSALAQQEKQ